MFVYFIQAGTKKGPIKIGYAKDVEKRMVELQVGCPFTLNLIFKLPAKSEKHAQALEAWFHDRWEKRHIRGEWFKTLKIEQILSCIPLAIENKDWDEFRAENGGDYDSRGPTRPMSEVEKTNQEQVDRFAHCTDR